MPFIALGIGVALAALDQLFKFLIVSNFELGQTRQFIPGILNLTYVRNEGVAFGMFAGMQWVFIVLTTVMLAAIIFYMFKIITYPFYLIFNTKLFHSINCFIN